MASRSMRKPSTTRRDHARALAGILALVLGTTAISALPAHAGTSGTSGSTATSTDPRYTALAQAESTGQPVTIDSLTTADSQTQALPDGTLATTTTAMPTRMQSSSGAWENIDPTLELDSNGSVSTTATPNPLTLSDGGSGALVTAADASGDSMSLSLPTSLPTPTLSGASATYADIYPGISLTVTAQPSGGFSEVFEVDSATAQAQAQSLKFTTTLNGLSLSQGTNDSFTLADSTTGQTFMQAPSAIMWDSATNGAAANNVPDDFETVTNPDSSTAGPGLEAHTGQLPITDSGSTLSLDGAASQLDTTTPTYPLYLDPTWTEPYQSGGTNNYTEVQSGCPTVANYDDVSQPGVGYNDLNGDGNCPGYGAYRSYFDLDTSNLNSADTIVSSIMKINEMYSAADSCGDGTENITVKWTGSISSSTTWSTQPAVISTLANPTAMKTDGNADGTTCSGGAVPGNFNVESAIAQNAASNGTHITLGLFGDESGSWESLERYNDNPSVYTVYDIPPNTPSNLATSPAPVNSSGAINQDCGGTGPGYLGITNLGGQHIATLSATLTSSVAAAQMQGIFSLTDLTTNTNVGNYTSSGYATSGATVSVQTLALTDGHEYAWSLHANDQYYSSKQSATCEFIVDQTPPNNPTITSTDFPALGSTTGTTKRYGQSGNNSGTITFTSTDPSPNSGTASGLKGFYYSLDEPATPSSSYAAASSGSASMTVTPDHWGTNTLYVQAVDNAGNLSADTPYSFYLPWYPGTKVTAGDVNGDGIPDLVTATPGGNLVMYPGNTDATASPTTLGTAAQSPTDLPWTDYQFSHDGSFHQAGVDDLWVFNPTTHQLYLYKNSGSATGDNFDSTGDISGPITKQDAATDAFNDSPTGDSDGTTACYNTLTFPTACSNYDTTDWSDTTQVVATPDLYAASPDSATLDGGSTSPSHNAPGLLTVENGALWYYQGQGTPDFIGTAVELGASGWGNYTVLSPVTVGTQIVVWARNITTGAISQYPVDYGPDGYPYLGTPSPLLVPGSPDLTAKNYPEIYAQVLHSTSAATYPDLVTQNTDGEVTDYPGAAPTTPGLASFDAPQSLAQPAGTLTASYQDSSGNLHAYTTAGTDTPASLTVAAGTSPSTIALPTGGYATAFRTTDSNGDLEIYNSATGVTTNTTEGVHASTSPSIAASATGTIQVAFQANSGNLYIYNASTGATTNSAQGMATGTNPSLAATPAGQFKAVFQANTTYLYLYNVNTNTTTATTKGMEAGTSPAIAAADDGDFAAVFQANTTDLWTYDPATGAAIATTKGMMSTSSPAITANPSGTFEIAFEANTGYLFGWDYNLDPSAYYGTSSTSTPPVPEMNNTSSPSVTTEPDGTFRVGIETSTGDLYIYNPATATGSDTGQTMNPGTSPSLTY
jgi:hypothetical protein